MAKKSKKNEYDEYMVVVKSVLIAALIVSPLFMLAIYGFSGGM